MVVDFTSNDSTSDTEYTSVDKLSSCNTLSTLFNKVSTMIKNIRYLYSKITQINSDITRASGVIYLNNVTSSDYWDIILNL